MLKPSSLHQNWPLADEHSLDLKSDLAAAKVVLVCFQGLTTGPAGDFQLLATVCTDPPSFCSCCQWEAAHCALTRQRTFIKSLKQSRQPWQNAVCMSPPLPPTQKPPQKSSQRAPATINLATNVPQNLFSLTPSLPLPPILMKASWMLPQEKTETRSFH